MPCSKAWEPASMVSGEAPPVGSQVTDTVTVPPGATVRGPTSAEGSPAAAGAAAPRTVPTRVAADRTQALRRMGGAPSGRL
ncbi:hypothetical protein [Streptomyces bluensis]|uniref:Uncharacterized protein n=1 Tax=Streptomyces bluensis TaxID=33897 RepID=A0ABW6UJR8_9ACTN